MRHMLFNDVVKELFAVEGRYIEWEWDPQTRGDDYITLREASGHQILGNDKNGNEFHHSVAREVVQRLIGEHSVCEDESKRASGFRVYRLTDSGCQ